ncbi:MAG: hypothetical protein IJD64_04110 [Clostridia bacterium]|nr:hypothetical protein [Clostridia bacterium]
MKTKWLTLTMLIGCGGLFAVLSFGFSLVYLFCNNNIILFQSILPDLIDIVRELTEILVWALAISLLSYAVFFRFPKSDLLALSSLLCFLLILHRIFELSVILIVQGKLDLFDDILGNLFYLVGDLLLVLIAYLLTSSTARAYYRNRAVKAKAKSLFANDTTLDVKQEDFYPFKKIFDKVNPLQLCLLKIAILFSATKILSRLLFDIGYGAPKDFVEFLIMFAYYLSDLLLGIVFYVFAILIFHRLFAKINKKENEKKLDDVN